MNSTCTQASRSPSIRNGQGHPTLPRPYVCPVYLLSTLMTLGLVSSALGRVSTSTPFSKVASAYLLNISGSERWLSSDLG